MQYCNYKQCNTVTIYSAIVKLSVLACKIYSCFTSIYTVGWVLIARFFCLRIASLSITRNQKNRRKKNTQLIIYCPLGNSQSLKSQSRLYSAIRNSLTTLSKPVLRYVLTHKVCMRTLVKYLCIATDYCKLCKSSVLHLSNNHSHCLFKKAIYTLPQVFTHFLKYVHTFSSMYTLSQVCTHFLKYLHTFSNIYTLSQIFTHFLKYLHTFSNIYTLSQVFTHFLKYLHTFSSMYTLSQVCTHFLKYLHTFSNIYTLSQVFTHFLKYLHTFSSIYTLSQVCAHFLKYVHTFSSMYTLSQVCTHFLKYVHTFSSMYTLSQVCTHFLKYMYVHTFSSIYTLSQVCAHRPLWYDIHTHTFTFLHPHYPYFNTHSSSV